MEDSVIHPVSTPAPRIGSMKAPHEKRRPITFTSHSFPIYTILGQIVCCEDVGASTCHGLRERPTKGMSAPLFHRENTSAADPRHERHSGAQYTGTRAKRLGKNSDITKRRSSTLKVWDGQVKTVTKYTNVCQTSYIRGSA